MTTCTHENVANGICTKCKTRVSLAVKEPETMDELADVLAEKVYGKLLEKFETPAPAGAPASKGKTLMEKFLTKKK